MRDTYTVQQFCERFNVSRSKLYELWQAGNGPKFFQVGRRKLISAAAATAWREELERATPQTRAVS